MNKNYKNTDDKLFHGAYRPLQDPMVQIPPESDRYIHEHSIEECQHRLKIIIDSARKVLGEGQVAIIVMAPYLVQWVTQQTQQLLGTNASDVAMIAEALTPKLGGPNSELVAEHVVRAATRAQLGIQNRNSIELRASSTKSYKADLDCYYEDPDLHATIALLTPMNDFSKMGYEEAQLSSIRYYLGILNSRDEERNFGNRRISRSNSSTAPASSIHHGVGMDGSQYPHMQHHQHSYQYHHQPQQQSNYSHHSYAPVPSPSSSSNDHQDGFSEMGDGVADGKSGGSGGDKPASQNTVMHDFIPSMMSQELEYFYAILPRSASGNYSNHIELTRAQSVGEQEQQAIDPDHVDPHQHMRLTQQMVLSPVLPRRPRDIAEVQAELERARLAKNLAMAQGAGSGTSKKNGSVRCLECGTDTSPEWRKGPNGPKTLCNRCGLRFAKKLRSLK